METPFLKKVYKEQVIPTLMKDRGYKNIHQVPGVEKVSINTGFGVADKGAIEDITDQLTAIAGQKPIITKARISVSNFKLRAGMPIGAKVTLRGNQMWEFLYRMINIALPAIRDFRGVPAKMDGRGNYTLGISDVTIFPEINTDSQKNAIGMDITIVTTTQTDEESYELLKALGMPFRKSQAKSQSEGEEAPAEEAAATA